MSTPSYNLHKFNHTNNNEDSMRDQSFQKDLEDWRKRSLHVNKNDWSKKSIQLHGVGHVGTEFY